MKKALLLTLVGSLFAVGAAFGHCGTCGVGDAAHDHKTKSECSADCSKSCCAEMKKACKEGCDKPCCAEMKKACKDGCDKPCCKKADSSSSDTAVSPPPACCAGGKASKPA